PACPVPQSDGCPADAERRPPVRAPGGYDLSQAPPLLPCSYGRNKGAGIADTTIPTHHTRIHPWQHTSKSPNHSSPTASTAATAAGCSGKNAPTVGRSTATASTTLWPPS